MSKLYADLLLPQNLNSQNNFLTYEIPTSLKNILQPGNIVDIPLKKYQTRGVIYKIHQNKPPFNSREILSISNDFPHLTKIQLNLLDFISETNFTPLYKCLKLFIPQTFFNLKKISPTNYIKLSNENTIQLNNLTKEQTKIKEAILNSNQPEHLIHGITGSGKTEIYKHLTNHYLQQNYQILILVPEISLTPQTFKHFRKHFGKNISIIHSKITPKQKREEWLKIKNLNSNIIIGSRSAIFAPFQNLNLIIIDEEHDPSFKQNNAPCYKISDIASQYAKLSLNQNFKIIYGSATPSIETFTKTQPHLNSKTYSLKTGVSANATTPSPIILHSLTSRFSQKQTLSLPAIEIIDLREELKAKNYSIFSEKLQQKLRETLLNGRQAILFLNKRGHSSSIICRECGYVSKCKNCDLPLTLHTSFRTEQVLWQTDRLICHHCGHSTLPPLLCPNCQSPKIKHLGLGTQKIESEILKLFPKLSPDRIVRADRDNIKSKDDFEKIYLKFLNEQADILIGTQMIAKGLHFPKVNLVGIVLADFGLTLPDFNAAERSFQLLTQVAGRAGREDKQGEVIIQTYLPNHYSIQSAKNHDYLKFYQQEIIERHNHNLPPFKQLIKLTISGLKEKTTLQLAEEIFHQLQKFKTQNPTEHLDSINLYPAFILKLKQKFRFNILLSGNRPTEFLHKFNKSFPLLLTSKNGIKIDVNPNSTL